MRKILYSLEDDGVFAYAVRKDLDNPIARYNPYDLICVGAAQTFHIKQMFMVTASAVTQVCQRIFLFLIRVKLLKPSNKYSDIL